MKKIASVITLLLVILNVYWSFKALLPTYTEDKDLPGTVFSTDRALVHVKNLAKEPHAVGFTGHANAREYIISQLEELGLEVSLQEGYTAGDWANLSKAINILARIKGTEEGKALLLLSHYDSNPHSSLGASDAGSGVATIIEAVRAWQDRNEAPKNDIIILITDAEELGLNGADLFVNNHPWIKDIGLVLNFEARGSGGPAYMLMETNGGNATLIEEFVKANPKFPVANSLAYSIYKMLPNDTDLTVFREDGDIEGFNFAFIDDHFDYHTVKDSYERLDRNTLAHQGTYLEPLLDHFSMADLTNLKTTEDQIYFNVPFFRIVTYPFKWIWPMIAIAILSFILLLVHGFKLKKLGIKELSKGFLPMILSLVINGIIGYYCWTLLKWIYPAYKDMLHGFTYNGHAYILAFCFLALAICFWIYHKFRKISTPNLLVAPLFLWIAICVLLAIYLPGASFFIIPVFGALAGLMVVLNQEKPNPYLLLFLTLPALWIFAPLIKMFPVGLGLKMLIASTLFVSLTFYLVLPLFGFYKMKKKLAYLCFFLGIGFLLSAHFNAGFDQDNAKPSSLLYVLDTDTQKAKWATYEHAVSDWTSQFIGADKSKPEKKNSKTLSSKYSTGFTFVSNAPIKDIPAPLVELVSDTIQGAQRVMEICITPQRLVNRLELFTNDVPIEEATVNQTKLSKEFLKNRRRGKLVTHYITDNEFTLIELQIPKDSVLELSIFEASNDLLSNQYFSVPSRPDDTMPMPFVLNDAILTTKTIKFE
jgi:hypothetical protein